jgi:Bacterial regulatory helix-turn-helix protein, lysR family
MVLDCTMIDWDDIRYFLAVARGGSVRAAAKGLVVNHATVLRRIAQLEERLGALMFEKLPSGYRVTAAARMSSNSRSRWKRRRTSWRRASSVATRACEGFCG